MPKNCIPRSSPKDLKLHLFNWALQLECFALPKLVYKTGWFCFILFCNWSRILVQLSQPIKCKTETNHDLVARVFPRFRRFGCFYFSSALKGNIFWLNVVIILVLVLWPSMKRSIVVSFYLNLSLNCQFKDAYWKRMEFVRAVNYRDHCRQLILLGSYMSKNTKDSKNSL